MLNRTRGIVRHLLTTRPVNFPQSAATASSIHIMANTEAIPRWKIIAQQGIANGFKEGEKNSVREFKISVVHREAQIDSTRPRCLATTVYQALSTVDPGPPPVPHVRYVVHRGFVNEQRSKETPSGVEPFDKAFRGSPSLILTTTDIRAPKALEMIKTAEKTGEGSRGEIVWWQESSQIQVSVRDAQKYSLNPMT